MSSRRASGPVAEPIELTGLLIKAIVEAIRHDEATIRDLGQEITALNLAHSQLSAALAISAPCHDLTTALSQGWSTLTTQTQQLQTFVQLLESNPDRDAAFRPLVQNSWGTFSANLARW